MKILDQINSLASVVLQNQCAVDTPFNKRNLAIIGEKSCFCVNRIEQIMPNSHLLKEKINTFHQINEAQPFYWTDLFPGLGDWFNG